MYFPPLPDSVARMVGIQSLTVLMAATLVISTGVIIGSISITTSNDLLSSERNISDESVQNCLSSGSRDITSMTARFLHATVNGVGKSIDTHLDGPVNAMNSIAHFARSRHPNTTTDPHFIDTVMRGLLYSEYKTISKGRHNIMFGTLPWSPDHEELKIDEHAASFGWGGFVSFFARGAGTDDDVVAETRDPFSNDALLLTRYMYTGLADSQGNMIIPDNTTCDPTTPRFGVCISHRNLTETVGVSTARHQAVVNFKYDDDSIVDPVDVVTYHPMSEFHNGLWMMVTLPFSHPEMQNNYARQNNLVGFVSSIVDGQALINILKEQELPEDSVIYCVERHPRTQVVGSLLGYNRGRVWSTTKDGVKMLNITEHTEEGETEPSMIAQHGNYVFSSGGYHAARDRTSGDMEQWTAANGTQYWTVTTLLEKAQLGWFVCLLVPRYVSLSAWAYPLWTNCGSGIPKIYKDFYGFITGLHKDFGSARLSLARWTFSLVDSIIDTGNWAASSPFAVARGNGCIPKHFPSSTVFFLVFPIFRT